MRKAAIINISPAIKRIIRALLRFFMVMPRIPCVCRLIYLYCSFLSDKVSIGVAGLLKKENSKGFADSLLFLCGQNIFADLLFD